MLQFVKDFTNDDEILIVSTNTPATREVIEQTAKAKEIGYDTVLLAPPFYTRLCTRPAEYPIGHLPLTPEAKPNRSLDSHLEREL